MVVPQVPDSVKGMEVPKVHSVAKIAELETLMEAPQAMHVIFPSSEMVAEAPRAAADGEARETSEGAEYRQDR